VRAAVIHQYGPPSVLKLEDVAKPEVRPKDVLIEVHAASINPVDTKIRGGGYQLPIRHTFPATLGMDVSGVVAEVGGAVTSFKVGDAVYSSPTHRRPGTYAEYVAVEESAVARKPQSIDHHQAAGLPLVALTAWASLVQFGKVCSGQRVLVQAGAGGVGSIAIQLAKHLGAHVSATCSTRNVELVTDLGADQVIDYTKTSIEEALEPQDMVVDSLGGEHRTRALSVLRRGGRLALLIGGIPAMSRRFGTTLGPVAAIGDLAGFMTWALLRHGIRSWPVVRSANGKLLAEISRLVDSGVIRPLVDRVVPLSNVDEGHRYSETGRARGKIIVAVQ
jgi:NADPH:quinone reductase-like Zn-dependent oxidoreductase